MVSAFQLSKTRPRSCSGSAQICLFVCLFPGPHSVQLFSGLFLDDFCEEFICFFTKKSLKKWDPGRHTTPNVTRFRTGHLAEVVALSSNGDCGATLPLGLFGGVAVGDLHLWRHLPPRVQF